MKLKEIYDFLDNLSPFALQEKWDNAGLLVGSFDDEIKNIYISIDLDEELVQEVEENSLIITHHPLIFSGLKRVNYNTYSTKLLRELIKKNISLISMHTNIDKTHFVGMSLGTIVIRQLAEDYSERFKSMVMGGAIMKINFQCQFLKGLTELYCYLW